MTLQHILRAAGIIRSTKISSNAIFFSIEKSYDESTNWFGFFLSFIHSNSINPKTSYFRAILNCKKQRFCLLYHISKVGSCIANLNTPDEPS